MGFCNRMNHDYLIMSFYSTDKKSSEEFDYGNSQSKIDCNINDFYWKEI